MGFLEGVAYKLLGNVYILADGKESECWTYWTDGVLRHRGTLFERKIKIGRDVLHIEEIAAENLNDYIDDAKLKLLGDVMSKEEMALILGMFVSPILGVPAYLARKKALNNKTENLQQEALLRAEEQRMRWMRFTLRDGKSLLSACASDVAAKILTAHHSV